MHQELIELNTNDSVTLELGELIVSRRPDMAGTMQVVVGRPGLPNANASLEVGDALLFETPDLGIFEVRLMMWKSGFSPKLLVSRVSPAAGLAGSFIGYGPENSPFSPEELARINTSLDELKRQLVSLEGLSREQVDFIGRKLDEMKTAAERMGRKDWTSFAAGVLTNTALALALNQEAARGLFLLAGQSLAWLFRQSVWLLV